MTRLLYILSALRLACGGRGLTQCKPELGYWLANYGSLPRIGFLEFMTIATNSTHTVLLVMSNRRPAVA